MSEITRKALLRPTKVEYGDYALNHVVGCSHGCKYPCYAYLNAKRYGTVGTYEEWCNPKLVTNALELLDVELPKLKDKIKNVQLCFTTDPFMYKHYAISNTSYQLLRKINGYGIPCTILTKGLLPIGDAMVMVSKNNYFGISLVSLSEKFRSEYEPCASEYKLRIAHLREMSKQGFKTWVSIEPYPTPNVIAQDLAKILEQIKFVDRIVFGRWNYNKLSREYKDHKEFYNYCANQAIDFCKIHEIECIIKKGTITESEDD